MDPFKHASTKSHILEYFRDDSFGRRFRMEFIISVIRRRDCEKLMSPNSALVPNFCVSPTESLELPVPDDPTEVGVVGGVHISCTPSGIFADSIIDDGHGNPKLIIGH